MWKGNILEVSIAQFSEINGSLSNETIRDVNLVKGFAVFLGLKNCILAEKPVFSPIVQYTCVVINLEKNSIFLNPAVFLR